MTLSPALTTASAQILVGAGSILDEERALADHWAADIANNNPAFRWIVAKYVEGNKPNSNNHYWAAEDLESSADSIRFTPMNMLHQSDHIVGSFIGSKFVKEEPQGGLLSTAEHESNPYIEVVGPFWRYYFPEELSLIESAFAEGRLFVSMECVAETARWHRADGQTKDFPYAGPNDPSYGDWGTQENILQFVSPHFVGGGLIVPPVLPGWGGAEVREIAQILDLYPDEAENVYEAVAHAASHLAPSDWEEVMLSIMKGYKTL